MDISYLSFPFCIYMIFDLCHQPFCVLIYHFVCFASHFDPGADLKSCSIIKLTHLSDCAALAEVCAR